jgi:hypothetical protein
MRVDAALDLVVAFTADECLAFPTDAAIGLRCSSDQAHHAAALWAFGSIVGRHGSASAFRVEIKLPAQAPSLRQGHGLSAP